MLLGELFYYEKKLESVNELINTRNLSQIEIVGINSHSLNSLSLLSTSEISNKLLTLFVKEYSSILHQEQLNNAYLTWSTITSPYKSNKTGSTFPIQSMVNKWLDGSGNTSIENLLDDIEFIQGDDEFAIIYGLKVIKTLLPYHENLSEPSNKLFDRSFDFNPETEARLLIIGNSNYSPLLTNLNCIFIDSSIGRGVFLPKVLDYLHQNPEISLVLSDRANFEAVSKEILKIHSTNVLVAEFELEGEGNQGFFDEIVKNTLGVRLV